MMTRIRSITSPKVIPHYPLDSFEHNVLLRTSPKRNLMLLFLHPRIDLFIKCHQLGIAERFSPPGKFVSQSSKTASSSLFSMALNCTRNLFVSSMQTFAYLTIMSLVPLPNMNDRSLLNLVWNYLILVLFLCFENRILAHMIVTTLVPRKGSLSNISSRDVFVLYCLFKMYMIN
ncbi:hypothetical protein H5410_051055 [Solanum commersonii]|uniref:Uncharacterized protein n=1 Tax=Solanum commersonii TaxID=4109 RepID=A0A9J5WZE3_SOLCO|nr:hypothetical protein H5410_051055 [Solanum commersonii]